MIDTDTCGHTSTLPPFFMVFLMALVSVPLTIKIAGPPVITHKIAHESADIRTKAKEVAVLLSKLFFLLVVWMAMYTDVKNVLNTFDSTRGFWDTVHCANLIVATGGMANFFKALAILSLITARINWKSGHDGSCELSNLCSGIMYGIHQGGGDRKTWAEIFECQGKITGVMLMSAFIFYFPWYIINMCLYQIPCCICYCWAILPPILILSKCVLERVTLSLMSFVGNEVLRNKNTDADGHELPESDLLRPEPEKYQNEPRVMKLMGWQIAVNEYPQNFSVITSTAAAINSENLHPELGLNVEVQIKDLRERWYPKTKEQFENTGAPGMGWYLYVYYLVVMNLMTQVSTMIMVEWYGGSGYLVAISNTFWNRHFLVWSGLLVAKAAHTYQTAWMAWIYVLTQSL